MKNIPLYKKHEKLIFFTPKATQVTVKDENINIIQHDHCHISLYTIPLKRPESESFTVKFYDKVDTIILLKNYNFFAVVNNGKLKFLNFLIEEIKKSEIKKYFKKVDKDFIKRYEFIANQDYIQDIIHEDGYLLITFNNKSIILSFENFNYEILNKGYFLKIIQITGLSLLYRRSLKVLSAGFVYNHPIFLIEHYKESYLIYMGSFCKIKNFKKFLNNTVVVCTNGKYSQYEVSLNKNKLQLTELYRNESVRSVSVIETFDFRQGYTEKYETDEIKHMSTMRAENPGNSDKNGLNTLQKEQDWIEVEFNSYPVNEGSAKRYKTDDFQQKYDSERIASIAGYKFIFHDFVLCLLNNEFFICENIQSAHKLILENKLLKCINQNVLDEFCKLYNIKRNYDAINSNLKLSFDNLLAKTIYLNLLRLKLKKASDILFRSVNAMLILDDCPLISFNYNEYIQKLMNFNNFTKLLILNANPNNIKDSVLKKDDLLSSLDDCQNLLKTQEFLSFIVEYDKEIELVNTPESIFKKLFLTEFELLLICDQFDFTLENCRNRCEKYFYFIFKKDVSFFRNKELILRFYIDYLMGETIKAEFSDPQFLKLPLLIIEKIKNHIDLLSFKWIKGSYWERRLPYLIYIHYTRTNDIGEYKHIAELLVKLHRNDLAALMLYKYYNNSKDKRILKAIVDIIDDFVFVYDNRFIGKETIQKLI